MEEKRCVIAKEDLSSKKLLTPLEVSVYLNVCLRTVERLIAEKKLKAYRILPKALRVKYEDLMRYINPRVVI